MPADLLFGMEPHIQALRSLAATYGLSSSDSGVGFNPSPSHSLQSAIGSASRGASLVTGVASGGHPAPLNLAAAVNAARESSTPLLTPAAKSSTASTTASQEGSVGSARRTLVDSPKPAGHVDAELEKWDEISREAKCLADGLRGSRLRTPFGQAGLPAHTIALLRLGLESETRLSPSLCDAQISLLRTMANLCIDHDANRLLFHRAGAVATLTELLDSILARQASGTMDSRDERTLTLLRTLVGALLNLQLDQEQIRAALRETAPLSALLRLARDESVYRAGSWRDYPRADEQERRRIKVSSGVASWTWRVLSDAWGSEDEAMTGIENEDEEAAAEAAASAAADEARTVTGESSNKKIEDAMQQSGPLVVQALLSPLRALAQGSLLAGKSSVYGDEEAVEDVQELVEDELEMISSACEALEELGVESHSFRLLAAVKPSPETSGCALESLMDFLEHADLEPLPRTDADEPDRYADNVKSFAQAKARVARCIVAVSGEDDNMSALFGGEGGSWFIERVKAWVGGESRPDLRSTGLLALGNLARRDSHCLALVQQHGILSTLVPLLSAHSLPAATATTPSAASSAAARTDIQTLHGVVGLLKNLSIPAANKRAIGGGDVIPQLGPLLSKTFDMVQPLQFGTVGVLKHLCAGVAENAVRVVLAGDGSPSVFDTLLELIARSEDVPTRMEGTRVIVNLARSLFSAGAGSGATLSSKSSSIGAPETRAPTRSDSQAPNPTLDAAKAEARRRLAREESTRFLAEMVRSSTKYPVLVNEGIFALALIGSGKEGAPLVCSALTTDATALPAGATAEDKERMPRRQPSRRGTADSAASTSSAAPAPPPTPLEMVFNVLARRDARMPPAFAGNACALVLSLIEAGRGADVEPDTTRKQVKGTVEQLLPSLHHLAVDGPAETKDVAQRALAAVQAL